MAGRDAKDACPPVRRAAAVILAAGESRRFGGAKLAMPFRGKPILQHVLDAANASACTVVIVVVGHDADALLARVHLGRARAVRNPVYAEGQSTSLRVGVQAADEADAAVVLLADQPGVTAPLIDTLIERQRATSAAAVVCSWQGHRSPPTLLHRTLWRDVERLAGDVGARELLAGRPDVAVLDVTPSLGRLDDVDGRDDLVRLERGDG